MYLNNTNNKKFVLSTPTINYNATFIIIISNW